MQEIRAWLPDFENRWFYKGILKFSETGIISLNAIEESDSDSREELPLVLPGLVDAHVHIESSMLVPSRFAELAVRQGTVATVSDPHEIANVLGKEGVRFMIRNAREVPLKIHFTAPSCVPATDFEEAGARLNAEDIAELLDDGNLVGLGEMMNFPGVLFEAPDVMAKIDVAKKRNLPIDGHAPGLRGKDLNKYIQAGITTDHEATSLEEAREKIAMGMKILIREGSAAKNFEALAPLIEEYPDKVMLCCDDLHPDDLMEGHLNKILKRGMKMGLNIFDLLMAASSNPIAHYDLNVGQLLENDPADFMLVESLDSMKVLSTWINGEEVFRNGEICFKAQKSEQPNTFIDIGFKPDDFIIHGETGQYRLIEVEDGSLFTRASSAFIKSEEGILMPDVKHDILKIAVVNRYNRRKPALAWIRNFGLKTGAISSSVAHDSHNIIVVGTSDAEIAAAVNALIDSRGGIAVVQGSGVQLLALPVGGIMSNESGETVGLKYRELSEEAKKMGSTLYAPFMTLSFMALLVIPELKLSDQGLFDGTRFEYVDLKTEIK